jgi:hypothetical protein
MALYTLPKQYHPDFADLRKKPISDVKIDRANVFGKNITISLVSPEITNSINSSESIFTTKVVNGSRGYFFKDASVNQRLEFSNTDKIEVQNFSTVTQFSLPDGSTDSAYIYNVGGRVNLSIGREGVSAGNMGFSYYDGAFRPVNITTAFNATDVYTIGISKSEGSPLKAVFFRNGALEFSGETSATGNVIYGTSRTATLGNLGDWASPLVNNQNIAVFSHVFSPKGLSEQDLIKWCQLPYQAFKPAIPQAYFTAEADGGITITDTRFNGTTPNLQFNGDLESFNFNGIISTQNINGTLSSLIYNGSIDDLEFNGEIQTDC